MSRDYKLHLEDILRSIQQIFKYTQEMDFDNFKADDKTLEKQIQKLLASV